MAGARPDTWMPLYIGDYMADTMHLTRDQHGAYFLLICAYWRRGGPLPNDDGHLASIAKSSAQEWRKLRSVMADFFAIGSDGWRHKRIDVELLNAQTKTDKRSKSGAKGARRRWQSDGKQDGNAIANLSQTASQNDACAETPSPSPVEGSVSSLRSDTAAMPLDVKRELWASGKRLLVAYGKTEKDAGELIGKWRKQVSDGTLIDILSKAEAGCPAGDIVAYIESIIARADAPLRRSAPVDSCPTAEDGDIVWRAILTAWKRSGCKPNAWPEGKGIPPGRPGCQVPERLLREFDLLITEPTP